MLWSRENISRRAALTGLLALAGCGFKPLYSANQTTTLDNLRGKIELPDATTQDLYFLRRELSAYFGEPSNAQYSLSVRYGATNYNLDIPQSGAKSRARVRATGNFTLTEIATGQEIVSRPFNKVTAYGYNSSDVFGRDEVLENARNTVASAVGDEIATQIIIALSEQTDR